MCRKGKIVQAIKQQGLFTLEEVRKHTKPSSSCGTCTELVEQTFASTVGGAYQPAKAKLKAVCGCTDYPHEDTRRSICYRSSSHGIRVLEPSA